MMSGNHSSESDYRDSFDRQFREMEKLVDEEPEIYREVRNLSRAEQKRYEQNHIMGVKGFSYLQYEHDKYYTKEQQEKMNKDAEKTSKIVAILMFTALGIIVTLALLTL